MFPPCLADSDDRGTMRRPNGRTISSPNTNPTLTADGTDLNIHQPQLPLRRDSTNTPRDPYSPSASSFAPTTGARPSSRRRETGSSSTMGGDRVARTTSTASSVASSRRGPYPAESSSSRSGQPSSNQEFGGPSASLNQSTTSSRQSHHSIQSDASSAATSHLRTPSYGGRYPAFSSASIPESNEGYSQSSYGGGSQAKAAGGEDFVFPRPSPEEIDRMYQDLLCTST